MNKLTQFQIAFTKDHKIQGEYEGNEKTGKVIIFSHGFGMKRDSRGMFTDLGDTFKDDYLIVRFDYCKMLPKENATLVNSFSNQAKILKLVIKYIRMKFDIKKLNILSHSMGCLVTGLAEIDNIHKAILLCCPPSTKIRDMETYFDHRFGTEFNLSKVSKVKRSDGSWTFIDPSFWLDIRTVNPPNLIKNLSAKYHTYFIRALQDDVIENESYSEVKEINEMEYIELQGDHNFKEPYRKKLLDTVADVLSK